MKDDVFLVPENTSIGDLIHKLMNEPHATFYTINDAKQLVGTITENELRPIITEYQHIRETLNCG